MAQPRYRHFRFYKNGKKFAMANAIAINGSSGDQVMYDSDGVAGLSDGITEMKLQIDCIVPVSGLDIDFLTMFIGKEEFTAKTLFGGKTVSFPARITTFNAKSDSKSGAASGQIEVTQAGSITLN